MVKSEKQRLHLIKLNSNQKGKNNRGWYPWDLVKFCSDYFMVTEAVVRVRLKDLGINWKVAK